LVLVDGTALPAETVLKFTAAGLVGGLRRKSDGMTYIGSAAGAKINDFIINDTTERIGRRNTAIQWNAEASTYQIKDLGKGSGTFARLDNIHQLTDNNSHVLAIGETHLHIYAIGQAVTVKAIGTARETIAQHTFDQSASPVTIGRLPDCSIQLSDKGLSRYQCRLVYNGCW
jgi:hypothetical protein